MSIRARDYLYLTTGGALVRQGDVTGRSLYCKPGDVISDADLVTYKAYFEAFGWIELSGSSTAVMAISSVHVKHDDASESKQLVLPPRSVVQDIYVVCTQAAAGSPDVDFGELGGDTDGLLDGLGKTDILDTVAARMDTSANFRGRGELITSAANEENLRTKIRRYYPAGVIFTNKCNSAGTAGEWTIHVMYVVLPAV